MAEEDRLLTEKERQQKYLDRLPADFKFPLFNAIRALESQRASGYRDSAAACRTPRSIRPAASRSTRRSLTPKRSPRSTLTLTSFRTSYTRRFRHLILGNSRRSFASI